MPKKISEELIRNNLISAGYGEVSQFHLNNLESRLMARLDIIQDSRGTAPQLPLPVDGHPTNNGEFALTVNGHRVFTWGSIMNHPVPEKFEVPLCSVKELWDQWHFPHHNETHGQLQPLKNIIPKRDLARGKHRIRHSKAKKVVDCIIKIGVEDQILVHPTTLDEYDALFASAFNELCNRLKLVKFANDRQIDKISYMTVYKDINEFKEKNIDMIVNEDADDYSTGM